jgi:hypothetical protein
MKLKFIYALFLFNILHAEIVIDGNFGTLSLSQSSTLSVPTNNTLRLKNITVNGIKANRIAMMGTTAKIILEDANLIIDDNYTFSQGIIEIRGNCNFSTTTTFEATLTYSGHHLLIQKNAELTINGPNLVFNCAPDSGIRRQIKFKDPSSTLCINNATLKNNNIYNGLRFISGTLKIEGTSTIDSTNTVTNKGILLGGPENEPGSDCTLEITPDSKLIIKKAGLIFQNANPTTFYTSGDDGALQIESGGNLILERAVTLGSGLSLLSPNSALSLLGTTTIDLSGNTFETDLTSIIQSTGVGTINSAGTASLITSSVMTLTVRERQLQFSHNGQYIAFPKDQPAGENPTSIYLFEIVPVSENGTLGSTVAGRKYNATTDITINTVDFSPDGKVLIVGRTQVTPTVITAEILSFDTVNGPPSIDLTTLATIGATGVTPFARWSPDGRFVAIVPTTTTLSIYRWDGTALTLFQTITDAAGFDFQLAWSPYGDFLAVSAATTFIKIFSFNETTGLSETSRRSLVTSQPVDMQFSPHGNFLAVPDPAGPTARRAQIFNVNTDGLITPQFDILTTATTFNFASQWSDDGNFLLTSNEPSPSGQEYAEIFKFNGSFATSTLTIPSVVDGTLLTNAAWSRKNEFIAFVTSGDTTNKTPSKSTFLLPRVTVQPSVNIKNGTIKLKRNLTINSGPMRLT